jgi:hypothetical protein
MKYLLLVVVSLVSLFPLNAIAGNKQSANVNLSDPIVVAGTQLKPGDYTVRWSGAGSDVQVQFMQGKKELVSAPAKLVNKHHNTSPMILTDSANGAVTLKELGLSDISLEFSK